MTGTCQQTGLISKGKMYGFLSMIIPGQTRDMMPPFKDPGIKLWIRKSFSYQYSSAVLMFKYELYSANLFFISLSEGNFTCHQIFDRCKPTGCGVYSFIGCEISDGKGDYRKYFCDRNGQEELTIFEIIRFLRSLRCYNDWKDYDQFQEQYKASGVTDKEIEKLLKKEIPDLGIIIENEYKQSKPGV